MIKIALDVSKESSSFEFTFNESASSDYLLTSSHTNEVFMLVPVMTSKPANAQALGSYAAFIAIIELDQLS